eukprot:748838-Hanusia_phi.AAC.16
MAQRVGEDAVAAGLASVGQPDNHEPVPNHDHLVELDGLLEEVGGGLQVPLLARPVHGGEHVDVVRGREHSAGKEILGYALEEREVVGEELGDVDVADGSEHQDVFARVLVCLLQVPCRPQHRHHRAHAVVVVSLRRELLAAELVRGDNLSGQHASVAEAEGHEHDLPDHSVVGDHHRHCPEQHLEVVGQVAPPSIARVHRDEDGAGGDDAKVAALEVELRLPQHDRSLDGHDLLCNH